MSFEALHTACIGCHHHFSKLSLKQPTKVLLMQSTERVKCGNNNTCKRFQSQPRHSPNMYHDYGNHTTVSDLIVLISHSTARYIVTGL
jgi:hypothetical protein